MIFIIIPVRNRCSKTLECLRAISTALDAYSHRIVVIDDGSTDQTAEMIRSTFPEVKIITGDGNLWWGGAVYLGIEYAVKNLADQIVLLNDDCRPTPEAWRSMIDNSSRETEAVFLADIHSNHQPPVRLNSTLVYKKNDSKSDLDELSNATGQFVIFTAFTVKQFGLPGKKYCPHYYDGVMFPFWKRQGAKIYRVNGARATCEWEAMRALEPYDRLLISPSSLISYFWFCLFHQKSRYKMTTRVSQMCTRHGLFKGAVFAVVRYTIFGFSSMQSYVIRLAGSGESEFRRRIELLSDHSLRKAVLSELRPGTPVTFS
ncbi:MAG: glycosyltransferase family 2 protein [Verrucomicrobia bacterium]|nr:glycosyltransferase family 2 protein [Verrucomicrobiota bacterium]